jgi:ribonuclease Z
VSRRTTLIVAFSALAALFGQSIAGSPVRAQKEPNPELLKAKEFFETAGLPGDKWIEGETMTPHVSAGKHFNTTMLYYPGTEDLQADEVRVVFMGSTYYPNESQSGMSIFLELGNGDRFVFDLGIGSLRNYNALSIPFNTITPVFLTHLHMDHVSDPPFS